MNEDIRVDFEIAKKARENAYVPYNHFKVGSVLVGRSGRKYTGCNVENHGIQSICAERVAFAKAISEGEKDFEKIVIVGGEEKLQECLPCGYCRQFMSEFVDKNFKVYTLHEEEIKMYTMAELLPYGFEIK